jgi:hypothetical protein
VKISFPILPIVLVLRRHPIGISRRQVICDLIAIGGLLQACGAPSNIGFQTKPWTVSRAKFAASSGQLNLQVDHPVIELLPLNI